MRYQERAAPVAGTVLWQRMSDGAPEGTPIMPDGCVDLVWDGSRLFVAGPDTAVRWHQGQADTTYVGLRFSGVVGPALLGVPADEVRDRTPNLEELWPARGPGPDRAGRSGPVRGVGVVGRRARHSLRCGLVRAARPVNGERWSVGSCNGRPVGHQYP